MPLELDYEMQHWNPSFEWQFAKPRLKGVREAFTGEISEKDVSEIVDAFQVWRDFNEYMVLEGKNTRSGEEIHIGVKCSKRGNDVFARRLDRRLAFLNRGDLRGKRFFNVSDFKPGATVTTPLLWVTLTFDSKLCSRREAWENVLAQSIHEFVKNLRKTYGGVHYVWFPHANPGKDGKAYAYPNAHMILYFSDSSFNVEPRMEEQRDESLKLVFRIKEKYELESAGKWHSFIDVKALSSMGAVVNYCRKYCQKASYGESDEAVLNNAMSWFFRKHTYSLSRSFRTNMLDLIRSAMQICPDPMGSDVKVVLKHGGQIDLLGVEVPEWEWRFYGIWSANDVGALGKDPPWVISLAPEKFKALKKALLEAKAHGGYQ